MKRAAAGDDPRSDAEIVSAINGGDRASFDVLYYRYREWTYRLAWRFTRDAEEAQDVVQEVFVYLARKCAGGGGLKLTAALTTFLYPAVKHSALALRQKRQRMASLSPEQAGALVSVQSRDVAGIRQEWADALRALSEPHREILLMRFVDDLSLDEIATALKIPLGTAKSRLHHAKSGLRQSPQLQRHFGAEGRQS
jgi:RNA polymerase sigma-70 factor (ECF subfamily)